jgi:hypothetical protein
VNPAQLAAAVPRKMKELAVKYRTVRVPVPDDPKCPTHLLSVWLEAADELLERTRLRGRVGGERGGV